MKRLAFCIAFFGLSYSAANAEENYIDSCAKSLTTNEVSSFSDDVSHLALLTYMTTSSSDEADFKSKFSGLVPAGFFDGSLSGARTQKKSLEESLKMTFSREEAKGYMGRYLSPEGANAFAVCVQTVMKVPGLHLTLEQSDETTAGVRVSLATQQGETRNFVLKITTDGVLQNPLKGKIGPTGFSRELIFFERKSQ